MRTGALASALAAFSPPNPPPTMTTCGSVTSSSRPALAAARSPPAAAGLAGPGGGAPSFLPRNPIVQEVGALLPAVAHALLGRLLEHPAHAEDLRLDRELDDPL